MNTNRSLSAIDCSIIMILNHLNGILKGYPHIEGWENDRITKLGLNIKLEKTRNSEDHIFVVIYPAGWPKNRSIIIHLRQSVGIDYWWSENITIRDREESLLLHFHCIPLPAHRIPIPVDRLSSADHQTNLRGLPQSPGDIKSRWLNQINRRIMSRREIG